MGEDEDCIGSIGDKIGDAGNCIGDWTWVCIAIRLSTFFTTSCSLILLISNDRTALFSIMDCN